MTQRINPTSYSSPIGPVQMLPHQIKMVQKMTLREIVLACQDRPVDPAVFSAAEANHLVSTVDRYGRAESDEERDAILLGL